MYKRQAEYKLRTRLLAIPGVGQVTVLGGRLPEYQVVYDPNKMCIRDRGTAMIKTARQLKDLIRNLSKKNAADAQVLMRN